MPDTRRVGEVQLTEGGSGRELESSDSRQRWDGTQFVPASPVSDEFVATRQVAAELQNPAHSRVDWAVGEGLADPFRRFLAWFINLVVGFAVIGGLAVVGSNYLPSGVANNLAYGVYFGLFHVVPIGMWGLTIGGLAAGVRVVRAADGESPGFLRALARLAIFTITFPAAVIVLGLFLLPAAAQISNTLPRRLWWDAAAGTLVVERTFSPRLARDAGSLAAFKLALHFGEGDLNMNRVGSLSFFQRLRLAFRDLWISLVGVAILGFVLLIEIMQRGVLRAPLSLKELLVALAGAGFGFYLLWRGYQHAADIVDGKVVIREARITRRMQRGDEDSSSARYYVFMPSDGPEFRVSKRVYSALVDGSYRFYTTPRGRRLVSIEPSLTSNRLSEAGGSGPVLGPAIAPKDGVIRCPKCQFAIREWLELYICPRCGASLAEPGTT